MLANNEHSSDTGNERDIIEEKEQINEKAKIKAEPLISTPQKQAIPTAAPTFQKSISHNAGYSKSATQSNEAHSGVKDKHAELHGQARVEQFNKDNNFNSNGHKKSAGTNDMEDECSPGLFVCRNESRFNFAKSVDPVKKDGAIGGFKFGFGANFSERDKDEILVPLKVQELIHRNIRTLSNSMSNRSPEEVRVPS